MSYTAEFGEGLRRFVAQADIENPAALNRLLNRLARWRTRLIVNTFVKHHGVVVLEGPFKGMVFTAQDTAGALAPRLFGSYESELHPHIERLAAAGLECVIDIGCAEGYYAVGLARLMPHATIHAYDIDERARRACEQLAKENGVADRVRVGGEFRPQDFQDFAGRNGLVFVDAEGAEDELLDPAVSPALAGLHLIVETHPMYRPGVAGRLTERFAATHEVLRLDQQPRTTPLPDWVMALSHLDQLLCVWEERGGPTPWLVMTPRR